CARAVDPHAGNLAGVRGPGDRGDGRQRGRTRGRGGARRPRAGRALDLGGQELHRSGGRVPAAGARARVAADQDLAHVRVCPGLRWGAARHRGHRVADHRRRGGDAVRGVGADRRVRDPGDRGLVRIATADRKARAGTCYSDVYVRIRFRQSTEEVVVTSVLQASPAKRRIGVDSEHDSYKWWALSCTSLGMLLATINSGTLIIALPDLERSLHTSLLELVWVILVYMIASTVLVLSAGRLSDQFGRKKAYVMGFVVFALASLGAGFAADGTQLILWRILQGIGGAFLFANAAAIVTDAFPKEQLGLAMGTNTMVAAVGLVIGPVLGGALVAISWHWVFWFNVPFGLAGALWGALVLRELAKPDEVRGYDVLGTCTFIVGFTGLVLGVSKGGISGWNNTVVIAGLAAAAVLLPLFVVIESRQKAPMLDLSIFRNRQIG